MPMKFEPRTYDFILPTKIRYGKGAAESLPDELERDSIRSVLVITDRVIREQPFTAAIISSLSARGTAVSVYDGVEANPKDTNVEEAAKQAAACKAGALIAIGGGSPIDCAKAVSVTAALGGPVRTYEDSSRIQGNLLPIFTIPTTAGTGSEVTFSSVITDTAENFKFTVKSPTLAPRIAFIDPSFTASMPPQLTAATGLDALTHAIEAFTAKVANPLSDAAALHAVELINRYLMTAFLEPDNLEARDGMMTGSLLAGIAFSHSDVASVHCIAEALGGKYDAPHGACNAIVLPVLMEYNLEYAGERYARIARAMGFDFHSDDEGARMAVERVKELVKLTGLPSFRTFGAEDADLPELARNSARNGSSKDNPRPMTETDYLEVLRILMSA
jgi:alcohol dehydrogenase